MVRIELFFSALLRLGVLLAVGVGGVGAFRYLWLHGREPVDYSRFHGPVPGLDSVIGTLHQAFSGEPLAWIQLGLLLLLLTPVARVMASLVVFFLKRDWIFTLATLYVFLTIVLSFLAPPA